MRNDAIVKFKKLLVDNDLFNDFKAEVKKLGMSFQNYTMRVEAIWAFRRVWNLYDNSKEARVAVQWEDMVILNGFSKSLTPYITQYGMQKTISMMHQLQDMKEWHVPRGLTKMQVSKQPIKDALDIVCELSSDEPEAKPTPATDIPEQKVHTPSTPVQQTPSVSELSAEVGKFKILDFSSRGNSVTIDDNHIFVSCRPSKHYIRFNAHISDLANARRFQYIQFCVDDITGKTYIVFSAELKQGSLQCRWNATPWESPVILNSTAVCKYLAQGHTLDDKQSLLRRVSLNVSRKPTCLTFELLDD